jgi:hypothetical protein
MNFLNMAVKHLADKYSPNSPNFGAGGVVGLLRGGQPGGEGGDMMGGPVGPGIEPVDNANDQLARSRGFRNYNEMMVWAKQRSAQRPVQTVGRDAAPEAPPASNAAPSMGSAFALHPKNMLDYITNAIRNATGQ